MPRATSGVKAHTLSVAWTTRLNAVKNGGAMTAPPFASELARKMQLTRGILVACQRYVEPVTRHHRGNASRRTDSERHWEHGEGA